MSTALRTLGALTPANQSRLVAERPLLTQPPRLTPRWAELLVWLNCDWDDRQPSVKQTDGATTGTMD